MTDFDDFPQPSSAELQQSHALSHLIRQEIEQQGGIISFSTFMALSLYHPIFGYYNTHAFNLSTQGDFITAPEVSPLFAECFAQHCLPIMQHIKSYHMIEIGAGTGRFASDLLMALERMDTTPVKYAIYEISPTLRIKQQAHIKASCPHLFDRITWLSQLPTNMTGIIIANEVLDALPTHCFRIGHPLKERGVTWKNGQFSWQLCQPFTQTLTQTVQSLQTSYLLKDGYESEVNLQFTPFIHSLAETLVHGVILLSDYGYGQREYYHPERFHGTLTCFYRHRYHHQPLLLPGLQDITSHVDFTRVIEIASDYGCSLAGYTSQSAFLLACGLLTLAADKEKTLSPLEQVKLHHAIKLLTLPTEMGERVKVMALAKNLEGFPLLGFGSLDRRREL